jgi:arsenate reductase
VEFEVVRYLDEPPTVEELDRLCSMLGVEPLAIVRTKDRVFRELGLSVADERSRGEWLEILAAHPRLLERPIVSDGERAVIGRPTENILGLL